MGKTELDYMDFADTLLETFGGQSYDDGNMAGLRYEASRSQELFMNPELQKAITVGSGAVSPSDTGGKAARVEFIHGALQNEAYADEDAATFESIKKIDVSSVAIQWVSKKDIGGDGDGFLGEKGDGSFNNLITSDSDYRREVENVKFQHDVREIGLVANESSLVGGVNFADEATKDAMTNIKGRSNLAIHYGDAGLNALSYNGIPAQIMAGIRRETKAGDDSSEVLLIDAGGFAIDKALLEDACRILRDQFSKPNKLTMSNTTYANLIKSLFPQQRDTEPGTGSTIGLNKKSFENPYAPRNLEFFKDTMLRANAPLVPQGVGQDGRPRIQGKASKGALAFAATPFSAVPAAGAQGTAAYYNNATRNTDEAPIGATAATTPATPYNLENGSLNRLDAGTYYYAIGMVYLGRESIAWVNGSAAAGILDATTAGTVVAANQVVKLTINLLSVPGMNGVVDRSLVRFRVYRAPKNVVPSNPTLREFSLLGEVGCPQTGNTTVIFDNGMVIPGTETAYITDEEDKDGPLVFFAQMLPLMRRDLPNKLLSDVKGYLLFGTPIVKKRTRHAIIRNIGPILRTNIAEL